MQKQDRDFPPVSVTASGPILMPPWSRATQKGGEVWLLKAFPDIYDNIDFEAGVPDMGQNENLFFSEKRICAHTEKFSQLYDDVSRRFLFSLLIAG